MGDFKTFRVVIEFDSIVADTPEEAAQIASTYLGNPLDLMYEVYDEDDETFGGHLIDLTELNR